MTPAAPIGIIGAKLPALNAVKATTAKKTRMPSLTNTRMVLATPDSQAPRMSSTVASATTMRAERLMTPPGFSASPGPVVRDAGSSRPKTRRVSLT